MNFLDRKKDGEISWFYLKITVMEFTHKKISSSVFIWRKLKAPSTTISPLDVKHRRTNVGA